MSIANIPGQVPNKQDFRPEEPDDWQNNDLGPDDPLPWQTKMPSESRDLALQIWGRALNPDIDRKGLLEYGVDKTAGDVGNPGIGSALGSKTGSAMTGAIEKKYSRDFGGAADRIKKQAEIQENPELLKSNELARSAEIYGKDQAIKMNNFKEQYAYVQQKNQIEEARRNAEVAARNGTIAGILNFATAF